MQVFSHLDFCSFYPLIYWILISGSPSEIYIVLCYYGVVRVCIFPFFFLNYSYFSKCIAFLLLKVFLGNTIRIVKIVMSLMKNVSVLCIPGFITVALTVSFQCFSLRNFIICCIIFFQKHIKINFMIYLRTKTKYKKIILIKKKYYICIILYKCFKLQT